MSQWFNKTVLSCFVKNTEDYSVRTLGEGLINQTLLVEGSNENFVLQCINQNVFPNPQNVVENSLLISRHLESLRTDYSLQIMTPRASQSGEFLVFVDGGHWRALSFISHCYSPQTIDDIAQARQAANTFAQFSMALSDLSTENMKPIIDNFHDLTYRLTQLSDAVSSANKQRLIAAQQITSKFQSQTEFINGVNDLVEQLPQRITHNDTKINNLLFDETTQLPKAVIDLDTCMPGYLMHDFGDMVRTCCGSLAEDDGDVDNMTLKSDIFDNLLEGYRSGLKNDVSSLELDSLLIGARLMPFIIGCRFLADYLSNDVYFNTSRDSHNLDRAINQFRLFELVSEHLGSSKIKREAMEY
jgi:Ser/Thr protein kinase RdoA (MazF antagonist)